MPAGGSRPLHHKLPFGAGGKARSRREIIPPAPSSAGSFPPLVYFKCVLFAGLRPVFRLGQPGDFLDQGQHVLALSYVDQFDPVFAGQ